MIFCIIHTYTHSCFRYEKNSEFDRKNTVPSSRIKKICAPYPDTVDEVCTVLQKRDTMLNQQKMSDGNGSKKNPMKKMNRE